jgi:Protein of unknown function (DUF559)
VAALATRQHGVVARRQLLEIGLSPRTIDRRLEAGRLHRAAFERDRARDAALQAAGYTVIRVTHRRLAEDAAGVVKQLHGLLCRSRGPESGQATVEWVGLLFLVALLLLGLLAAGVRVPGAPLAQAIASRLLCAAAVADSCGDETDLIAAYGSEVGALVRERMPSLAFEHGSRAVPVDFRRCREAACADGLPRGLVLRSAAGLPVTSFVHVIDCRDAEPTPADADCSGTRAGHLYIQYWTYYPDSSTLRGVPVVGAKGYHRDDWESVQIRIGPDGRVEQRASSHHGYNHVKGIANAGSDAGVAPLRDFAETVGARPRNGWGRASPLLFVSGGSHAGNVGGFEDIDRLTPGSHVKLIPLEPIAATSDVGFAVTPPWRKRVWLDPEAPTTE